MLKRILIGALLTAIALFLALWIYVAFFLAPVLDFGNGASQERIDNEKWLYAQVEAKACTTPDDLRALAAERGWLVETHDTFRWCASRDDLSGWMSVTVEPALFMSTDDENRRYFGFDAQGCSATWTYSSC